MASSVFENIELNVKTIFKDRNPFGWKKFSPYIRCTVQKNKHTKRNKKQFLKREGV